MKATNAKEKEAPLLNPQLCIVCNKLVHAPYGRHNANNGVVWTCGTKCERLYLIIKKGG